jgi:hypothetical protein
MLGRLRITSSGLMVRRVADVIRGNRVLRHVGDLTLVVFVFNTGARETGVISSRLVIKSKEAHK